MPAVEVPSQMEQILVQSCGTDFRQATHVVLLPVPQPGHGEVLVKNRFVGVNAIDISVTAGTFGLPRKPPFSCGFEGLGEVVRAGKDSPVKEGQFVVYSKMGAYADYVVISASSAIPVISANPDLMSIALSGLTASVALEKEGDLKAGQTVLVTAAAGGTGQFAVQLAKAAGCHVIGTCSTDAKVQFLKVIGCDRPVNYKKENLDHIITKEYENGLDVVYESVGSLTFDTALKHLASKGRMIVIGMISTYRKPEDKSSTETSTSIPLTLITKSASIRGFSLMAYPQDFARHLDKLMTLYRDGKVKVSVDTGAGQPFRGLHAVADAIEYMYSGQNTGKVVVTLGDQ